MSPNFPSAQVATSLEIVDDGTMRVLQIHNRYVRPAGEEAVVESECQVLRQAGHAVEQCFVSNDAIADMRWPDVAKLAFGARTMKQSQAKLGEVVRDFKPDVLHVHNTFPMLKFSFLEDLGLPYAMTFHNFRAACLNGLFFRDGKTCTSCLDGASLLPGLIHRCYRGSFVQSAAAANFVGEFRRFVSKRSARRRFIVLNPVQNDMLIRLGAAGDEVVLKPNFLPFDPGEGVHDQPFGLFVGRLEDAKGFDDVMASWHGLDFELRVAGEPKERWARKAPPNVVFLGQRERLDVLELMKRAKFLVYASRWQEGSPMVLFEALATGLPVVAPDVARFQAIVPAEQVGWKYRIGSSEDLKRALAEAMRSPAEDVTAKSRAARALFRERHSSGGQAERIVAIYRSIVGPGGSRPDAEVDRD